MTAHRRDEELFTGAVALPTAERTQYLRRACGTDLSAFNRLSILIDAFDDAAALFADSCEPGPGGVGELDSFRLLRELGEGGCGVAYLAEQIKPVRRLVAVKVIKPGMDTRAVIARFEAERQVLALMDHPHVAKVFDAGSTSTGRPYFVMELVRGSRITDYCNQTRCTIAERLRLFIQVCQAIQHAHQKGIIHRDIKPSNVVVTMHDGLPLAKVIDFGIARATQGRLIGQTYTAVDYFVGTPEYVSPEQTGPNSGVVDTRSDIYSLGVLLYELLTGCTPFETEELRRGDLEYMRQHVRTHEPARPSLRLRAAGSDSGRNMSAHTGMPAARVLAQVRGDLDWIVMRCLEKDPARRYPAVTDVINELQRYLHHQPVEARPPQSSYIIAKFARRNRATVTAALAAIVVTIAFVTNVSIQSRRVAVERDTAESISEFMQSIFDQAQPQTSLGRQISARAILDAAGRRIRGDLTQQPEVRAALLETIGRAYRRLNQHATAVPYFKDALRLREQLPDPDGTKTASLLIELAISLRTLDDLPQADKLLKRAMAICRVHQTEKSATYAKLLLNIGRVQAQAGNLKEARRSFEKTIALGRELGGAMNPEVASALLELSSVYVWNDDLPAAERSIREALIIFNATRPMGHPDLVLCEHRLGEVLMLEGRTEEAAPIFENSLLAQAKLYGNNSVQVADVLESLASIRRTQGQLQEAEDLGRRALQTRQAAVGHEDTNTGFLRMSLAVVLTNRGKYDEAEKVVREALAIYEKTLPPDHQYVAAAEHGLGEVLLATGRLRDAEACLIAAIHRWRRTHAGAWRIARSQSALGEVLYREGRAAEAERHLVDSYRVLAADETADRDARIKAQDRITRFYTDRGERGKLEELMLETREGTHP